MESLTLSDGSGGMDKQTADEVFKCFQANMDNFTDFTVNVGDFEFDCHRFILGSCSGFFEALMRTDMREKSESRCTIEGISPYIFALILDVIYKGKNVLNEENMLAVWQASNQLQIKFLISACESFVQENITLENYWSVYREAKLLDSEIVLTKVKKLMVDNFLEIAESNDLMQLMYDEFSDLLKDIQFVEADFVVDSVLKWTCSDDSFLTSETVKGNCTFEGETSLRYRKVDATTDDNKNATHRRAYLGPLLALLPLEDTSNACLTGLMNNRFVMENIDAITLVNKLAASRVGVPRTNSSKQPLNSSTSTKTNGFRIGPLKLNSDDVFLSLLIAFATYAVVFVFLPYLLKKTATLLDYTG